jgi:hypothetical protein
MRRALPLLVAALAACGPTSGAPPAGASDGGDGQFVAFAADFAGYRTWAHITVVDDGGDPTHAAAVLTEYINESVPAAGVPFPVGTIIVKEPTTGDPDTRQAFAMVKRGGTYNAGGAAGWEWFELQNVDDAGDVGILWRGTAPPLGEKYAGNISGDCNTCHQTAPHDAVFAQ